MVYADTDLDGSLFMFKTQTSRPGSQLLAESTGGQVLSCHIVDVLGRSGQDDNKSLWIFCMVRHVKGDVQPRLLHLKVSGNAGEDAYIVDQPYTLQDPQFAAGSSGEGHKFATLCAISGPNNAFKAGQEVKVIKRGSSVLGQTGVIVDPDFDGYVKIKLNGAIKSYKQGDLELLYSTVKGPVLKLLIESEQKVTGYETNVQLFSLHFSSEGELLEEVVRDPQGDLVVRVSGSPIFESNDLLPVAISIDRRGKCGAIARRSKVNRGIRHEWHLLYFDEVDGPGRIVHTVPTAYAICAMSITSLSLRGGVESLYVAVAGDVGNVEIFYATSDYNMPCRVIRRLSCTSTRIHSVSLGIDADAVATTDANEVVVWSLTDQGNSVPHLRHTVRTGRANAALTKASIIFNDGRAVLTYGSPQRGRSRWYDRPHFLTLAQQLMDGDNEVAMNAMRLFPDLAAARHPLTQQSALQLAVSNNKDTTLEGGLVAGLVAYGQTLLARRVPSPLTISLDRLGSSPGTEAMKRLDEGSLRVLMSALFGHGINVYYSLEALSAELGWIGQNFPGLLLDFFKSQQLEKIPTASGITTGIVRRLGETRRGISAIDVRGSNQDTISLDAPAPRGWSDVHLSSRSSVDTHGSSGTIKHVTIYRVPMPDLIGSQWNSGSVLGSIVAAAKTLDDTSVFDSEVVDTLLHFQWHSFASEIFQFSAEVLSFRPPCFSFLRVVCFPHLIAVSC